MKDTPAGVGGSEGIIGTCPGARSITGKPPWVGMEGMDIGVPCCITAEPGGEEPPGGKKTWAMAPEGIHGLALAIQSPVCWLPEALSIHSQTHAQVQSRAVIKNTIIQSFSVAEGGVHTHTDTWTHTEQRVPSSSVLYPPPPSGSRKKSLSRKQCFFPPLSHLLCVLLSADSCYCPGTTSMSSMFERHS